jgi:anti-sigma factor (TIGR02949 family)
MSETTNNQECLNAQAQMDEYLDRNLSEGASGRFTAHVTSCSACTQEMELRRKLRGKLKAAVKNTPTPPYLENRIRANIRSANRPSAWVSRWIAVAATLVIGAVGGSVAYHFGYMRFSRESQDSYIASVNSQVPTVMRIGLSDHVHCSVFRKFPRNPPKVEEMAAKLGPEYAGLIPIVREHVPDEFRLVMAHQCGYRGRKFVHLALKSDSRLISLVIAVKGAGESFSAEQLLPALTEFGIPLYNAGVQRFQIAAFESSDRLVYVISDLPQGRNTEMLRAMAPALREYLQKLAS